MKKFSMMVSLTLALAMILAACSGAPATNPNATPTAATSGTGATPTESTGGLATPTTATGTTTTETPGAMATTGIAATTAPLTTETPAGVVTTPAPLGTETAMATVAPTSTSTTGTSVLPNTGSTGADRMSHMLQYPVIGQSGQEVAKVADVVVNLGTSMVDYVIIQPGAAMKLGNVFIPVPYSAMAVRAYEGATTSPQSTAVPMSTATVMTGTTSTGVMATATAGAGMGLNTRNLAFYLNVDDNTLKNAPHFTGLPAVSATSWDQKMSAYWSNITGGTVTPGTTTTATAVATSTSTSSTGSTTTTATPMAVAGAASAVTATSTAASSTGAVAKGMKGHILGSSMLTYRLNDSAAANVAKVTDAVVDLATGRIMYLLVSGGTSLGIGNKVALVPMQVFRNNPGATNFTLTVPTSVVAKAPLFNLNELPDFSANNWDAQLSSYWQSNMGTR